MNIICNVLNETLSLTDDREVSLAEESNNWGEPEQALNLSGQQPLCAGMELSMYYW